MLDKQKHACAICKYEFGADSQIQRPHIDHCHTTGKVRGLLCMNCNIGIGHFQDDPAIIYNALVYLERNES